jgi:hypothetical protein
MARRDVAVRPVIGPSRTQELRVLNSCTVFEIESDDPHKAWARRVTV